jgi:predicted nucleotide-binding protein (sugar kinase/HSP70/actin superfamily)
LAKLIYDDEGRLLFTKEMREEYTVLFPDMLGVHFSILEHFLQRSGFHFERLKGDHDSVINEGLKYVHNDLCYPAMIVVGQFLEALKSGKYDTHKVALCIFQSGGGCRFSNYIHIIRKALKRAGMEYVPVLSINLSRLEPNPGFKLTPHLLKAIIYVLFYGDFIMHISNQCRPYELNEGETDCTIEKAIARLDEAFKNGHGFCKRDMLKFFKLIGEDFAAIRLVREPKIKIGITGEIYVKFSPLANNNLEKFVLSEGFEPVVPGIVSFLIFKIFNREIDVNLYGGSRVKRIAVQMFKKYVENYQYLMNKAIKDAGFTPPGSFQNLYNLITRSGYLGLGNKMGEGWLLTAEMLEFIESGINDVICVQPFGCLPNHVVGRGMVRSIKNDYPKSNIVTIDYDPSATKINQENRIKLMFANARRAAKNSFKD